MNRNLLKHILVILGVVLLLGCLVGCEPKQECQDIRVEMEKMGYLDGWTYVKNIESLDGETNPVGRILFALYVSDDNPDQYAVMEITALTVPQNYSGEFCKVDYNEERDTASSDDESPIYYNIVYGSDEETKDITVELSIRNQ